MFRKLDETAARQKQREEEAEARRSARKTGAEAPRAEPTERTAPRLNLAPRAGGGPSWRERQAAKEPEGTAEPPEEEPQPTRRPGGYVPPHLRSGAGAGAGASSNGGAAPERYVPRQMRERDSGPAQPPSRNATPGSDTPDESKPSSSTGKWIPRWKQQG